VTAVRPHTRRLLLALAVVMPGCGGSDPSGPSDDTPPAAANPCDAALAGAPPAARVSASAGKRHRGLGSDVRDPRDAIWTHRVAARARGAALPAAARDEDVGDVAVLEDDGSLIVSANPFDLAGVGLRFQPNAAGGYDVSRGDATFRSPLGDAVTLADDDTSSAAIPFSFPFYGRGQTAVFVNSDGNLTFGQGDTATTERGLGRVLSGPPRVAPFFADLDPSAGGRVFVNGGSGAFTVTWCAVRGFDSPSSVTTQASLLPDGSVEIKFGAASLGAAIVAVSPGATTAFAPADLRAGTSAGGAGAVGERFADNAELDLVGAARRFLAGHPDDFDQLAFWTDTGVVDDNTFAFQTTIKNDIRGIGKEILDFSAEHGSGGRLRGLLVMDDLGKYPEDPTARVVGVDSTLAVMSHECGHLWLARLLFRDSSGSSSDLLLGRQRAHWSFFFDSDASFMEGNDIEDLGGGSFRTVAAGLRYGPLDLYAMGLVGPSAVPVLFFVDNPTGTSNDRESDPRPGVAFNGTRREVRIDQIVQALGARQPDSRQSPRLHRVAFVYVVGRGRTASASAVAKLDRIRRAWEPFFADGTGDRMTVDTRLP
jgi:hypothetical protein